jgi:hypothetical protein
VSLAASFVVTSGVAKLSYVGASWFTAAMREALALVVWNRVTGDYVAYAKGDAGANTFSFATFNDWPDELRVVVIGRTQPAVCFKRFRPTSQNRGPYAEAAESWVSQVQALGAEQTIWPGSRTLTRWPGSTAYSWRTPARGPGIGQPIFWRSRLARHVDYNYYDSEQSSAFVAAFHLDNGGYTWGGGILARAGGTRYSTSPLPQARTRSLHGDSESPRCAVPSGGDTEPWGAYFGPARRTGRWPALRADPLALEKREIRENGVSRGSRGRAQARPLRPSGARLLVLIPRTSCCKFGGPVLYSDSLCGWNLTTSRVSPWKRTSASIST